MKYNIIFFIAFLILNACSKKEGCDTICWEEFKNPSNQYRSIPFYSLNDKLDTHELKRQLVEFARGGFGGSYLHSRIGLLTEYLGEEWWQAMDVGVRVSDSLGIQAWFYDEDKWPSGFAGGIVPRMNNEFRGHALLRVKMGEEIPATGKILYSDAKYHYVDYEYEMGQAWFNGTCWVDLMNPDMVKAFIDTSYAPYAHRYKKYFGKTAQGIFTDEPQVGPQKIKNGNALAVAFSPFLLKRFSDEHGYDLIEHLPSLFDTVGNFRTVRIHYYRTLSNQYEESFSRQIGEYCRQHNMIFTGHYFEEQSTNANLRNGGNLAIQYRHQQQPGIDHLFLRIDGDLHGAKQMTSVANQYGIKRRLSEAFGVSGQNMSFEDRKWIVDWHGLMGINHICPHLSLYSMKGERKRDYPPTISPQQPWWKYNKVLEDYSARICYMNTLGQQQADVLVVTPLETAMMELNPGAFKWNSDRDNRYLDFLKKIIQQHVLFDIGDEQILEDTAFIADGKIVVGNMKYKALVLPYMETIRSSTLQLVKELGQQGVKTYFVGQKPRFIDGVATADSADIPGMIHIIDLDNVIQSMEVLQKEIRVSGDSSHYIWMSKRSLTKGEIYQLSNTSRLETILAHVELDGENLVLWDPATSLCYKLHADNELLFAPAQTYFITSGSASEKPDVEGDYILPGPTTGEIKLANEWEGKRREPNVITLDFATYINDNEKENKLPEPVIAIHKRLEKEGYSGSLSLFYRVDVEVVPEACSLVVEQPGMYSQIVVNGKKVDYSSNEFYRDHSFKMKDISGLLNKGENIIRLELDYIAPVDTSYNPYKRYGTEIESIYLVGEFGVFARKEMETSGFITERESKKTFKKQGIHRLNDFYLSSEKTQFSGSLVTAGYPFYNGDIEFVQRVVVPGNMKNNYYILSLDDIDATVIIVSVNGQHFAPVAWSPWEVDVTSALKEGENEIRLMLTNSLRNMLGPHHHVGGELVGVGPGSFTGASFWTSPLKGENDWYDKRKSGQAALWVDDYFLVPFGVRDCRIIIRNKN